jgi:hypothetical protein
MKKLLVLAVACVLSLTALASTASADGCAGPFCNSGPYKSGGGLFGGLFARQPMPAFQAAPWYSYYPYNSHFMTPAPMMSPFAAPPYVGGGYGGFGAQGMMTNPYFPTAPQVMPGTGR